LRGDFDRKVFMRPPTSFRELLECYRRGERNFAGAELDEDPDNDLNGVCLDGADLSRSFVIASFQAASLRETCFREANVKTCDFSGADLRGANFSGAALCATSFGGAKMEDACFVGAYFHGRVLQEGEKPNW
jgi:uncharacterized protein YjbI with pentapeptide repeats